MEVQEESFEHIAYLDAFDHYRNNFAIPGFSVLAVMLAVLSVTAYIAVV